MGIPLSIIENLISVFKDSEQFSKSKFVTETFLT